VAKADEHWRSGLGEKDRTSKWSFKALADSSGVFDPLNASTYLSGYRKPVRSDRLIEVIEWSRAEFSGGASRRRPRRSEGAIN
jgi:hypothetical protein